MNATELSEALEDLGYEINVSCTGYEILQDGTPVKTEHLYARVGAESTLDKVWLKYYWAQIEVFYLKELLDAKD